MHLNRYLALLLGTVCFPYVVPSTSTIPLTTEKGQLNEDQQRLGTEKTDVIRLNVGGERILTTRATLTRVPNSILAHLFSGRWEEILSRDLDDYLYLDFNPILFRYLLEQLRLSSDTHSFRIYPSSTFSSSLSRSFEVMLKKLGLSSSLEVADPIVPMNVGGQLMITRKKTLRQTNLATLLSRAASHLPFVDADPELFQHLIRKLRDEPKIVPSHSNLLSKHQRLGFHRLLQSIIPKPISSTSNRTWAQNGVTVAGGLLSGHGLHELSYPSDLVMDDRGTMFIADYENHRIMSWKFNATSGDLIAGGKDRDNGTDQLNQPVAVAFDQIENRLIVSDLGNQRVIGISLTNPSRQDVLVSNIRCRGLAMDEEQSLYLTDYDRDAVWYYRKGEQQGKIIAGGNGKGDRLNQFNGPYDVVVADDTSIYVSDENNHRVMKWLKNANEGIIVAGGHGPGHSSMHLLGPRGIYVDSFGSIFVTDGWNHRVMRWLKGAQQGTIIVGERGEGSDADQLSYPRSLTFDRKNHLYVVDRGNHRIQRYSALFSDDDDDEEEENEEEEEEWDEIEDIVS